MDKIRAMGVMGIQRWEELPYLSAKMRPRYLNDPNARPLGLLDACWADWCDRIGSIGARGEDEGKPRGGTHQDTKKRPVSSVQDRTHARTMRLKENEAWE